MESIFKKVSIKSLNENYLKILNEDWGLVTAGNIESFNTMTISWGTFGVLWNRPVFFCFVRPQRFTYEFINTNHYYTLSFFTDQYKDALDFCGNHSGREFDKMKSTELVPVSTDIGNVIFEQTRLAFECKKIYTDDIKPENLLDPNILKATYPNKDYHRMFVGEIVNCFVPY